MTSKQADRLRQKIADIKRILATEKRKFGAYDDSRGMRFLPPRYYIQLSDFQGGLTYLRWFRKNFPDDAGFPDFLFECTIILYKNGKLKDAEQKAIETFCSDTHLLNSFLGRPRTPTEPWEDSTVDAASYTTYFDLLGRQNTLLDFAEWLTAFMASLKFGDCTRRYLDMRRQLHGEQDLEKRRYLVEQLGQIVRGT